MIETTADHAMDGYKIPILVRYCETMQLIITECANIHRNFPVLIPSGKLNQTNQKYIFVRAINNIRKSSCVGQ